MSRIREEGSLDGKLLRGNIKGAGSCYTDLTGCLPKAGEGDEISRVEGWIAGFAKLTLQDFFC